jgi:hypothetical protein
VVSRGYICCRRDEREEELGMQSDIELVKERIKNWMSEDCRYYLYPVMSLLQAEVCERDELLKDIDAMFQGWEETVKSSGIDGYVKMVYLSEDGSEIGIGFGYREGESSKFVPMNVIRIQKVRKDTMFRRGCKLK